MRLDFKQRYNSIYKQVWIVGVYESEILFIEMPKDHDAPSMIARNATRRVKMSSPLLDIDTEVVDGKELTLPQMEAQLQNMWLSLEHEIFRKQNWEQLKHFRSKYDNEYQQSESILDNTEIASKKKAMDKICVSAIRYCIHHE